jgi:hypothetical protein
LESQRVRSLKEGYLRGWLRFDYPNLGSRLREELVIEYIEEQHIIELLQNRLLIETSLRSNLPNKTKDTLKPIFDTATSIIELKLPSASPKAKIKDKKQSPEDLKKEMAEWKELFKKAAVQQQQQDK